MSLPLSGAPSGLDYPFMSPGPSRNGTLSAEELAALGGNAPGTGVTRVRVVTRCRPMSSNEKQRKSKRVVKVDKGNKAVSIVVKEMDAQSAAQNNGDDSQQLRVRTYAFDDVFDEKAKQADVYKRNVSSYVHQLVEDGINGTIFAYGQTGCGKTFTMQGEPQDDDMQGIMPRVFKELFDLIDVAKSESKAVMPNSAPTKFHVTASYVEIYNEDVRDLLSSNGSAKLDLLSAGKDVELKGVKRVHVKSPKELMTLLDKGIGNRVTGATEKNSRSSRSHAIFTITVKTTESYKNNDADDDDDSPVESTRVAKLNLVDLAGSERPQLDPTSPNSQELFKEATKINLSLTALGRVITALIRSSSHVPYRSSKLTMLLRDSLGGTANTLMIACISPSDECSQESLTTLQYACRAKKITNSTVVAENPKDKLLRVLQQELRSMKEKMEEMERDKVARNSMSTTDLTQLREMQLAHQQRLAELAAEKKGGDDEDSSPPSRSESVAELEALMSRAAPSRMDELNNDWETGSNYSERSDISGAGRAPGQLYADDGDEPGMDVSAPSQQLPFNSAVVASPSAAKKTSSGMASPRTSANKAGGYSSSGKMTPRSARNAHKNDVVTPRGGNKQPITPRSKKGGYADSLPNSNNKSGVTRSSSTNKLPPTHSANNNNNNSSASSNKDSSASNRLARRNSNGYSSQYDDNRSDAGDYSGAEDESGGKLINEDEAFRRSKEELRLSKLASHDSGDRKHDDLPEIKNKSSDLSSSNKIEEKKRDHPDVPRLDRNMNMSLDSALSVGSARVGSARGGKDSSYSARHAKESARGFSGLGGHGHGDSLDEEAEEQRLMEDLNLASSNARGVPSLNLTPLTEEKCKCGRVHNIRRISITQNGRSREFEEIDISAPKYLQHTKSTLAKMVMSHACDKSAHPGGSATSRRRKLAGRSGYHGADAPPVIMRMKKKLSENIWGAGVREAKKRYIPKYAERYRQKMYAKKKEKRRQQNLNLADLDKKLAAARRALDDDGPDLPERKKQGNDTGIQGDNFGGDDDIDVDSNSDLDSDLSDVQSEMDLNVDELINDEEMNEFTDLRYTPVFTETPFTFKDELYTLWPKEQNRDIRVMIVITMYNERRQELEVTMKGIAENLKEWEREPDKGVDFWKHVMVVIVSDGRKKMDESVWELLTEWGMFDDELLRNSPYRNGYDSMYQGENPNDHKDVRLHLFEHTTMLHEDSNYDHYFPPIQMALGIKEENSGKLDSHLWFFNAFCHLMQPTYTFMIDVGTYPCRRSLCELYLELELHPEVAGVCGEIKPRNTSLLNPVIAAQEFEYLMAQILDKCVESVLGYITVLPGAFSAYRYETIKVENANGPLASYFKSIITPIYELGPIKANMYLAEDRILCFELAASKNKNYLLQYVSAAVAETDVPDDLVSLIQQRRRWMNGAFFASVYALQNAHRMILRAGHSMTQKLIFCVETVYLLFNLLFNWFFIGNLYLSIHIVLEITVTEEIYRIVQTFFLFLLLGLLIYCLGNDVKSTRHIYSVVAVSFGAIMILTVVTTTRYVFTHDVGLTVKAASIGAVGMYFIIAAANGRLWSCARSAIQYLIMLPTYGMVFSLYSFSNTHDISWGTKSLEAPMHYAQAAEKVGFVVKENQNITATVAVAPKKEDTLTSLENPTGAGSPVTPLSPRQTLHMELVKAAAHGGQIDINNIPGSARNSVAESARSFGSIMGDKNNDYHVQNLNKTNNAAPSRREVLRRLLTVERIRETDKAFKSFRSSMIFVWILSNMLPIILIYRFDKTTEYLNILFYFVVLYNGFKLILAFVFLIETSFNRLVRWCTRKSRYRRARQLRKELERKRAALEKAKAAEAAAANKANGVIPEEPAKEAAESNNNDNTNNNTADINNGGSSSASSSKLGLGDNSSLPMSSATTPSGKDSGAATAVHTASHSPIGSQADLLAGDVVIQVVPQDNQDNQDNLDNEARLMKSSSVQSFGASAVEAV